METFTDMNIGRYIGTSATTDTDISVLPIMAFIGRYSISADTDMPTLGVTKGQVSFICSLNAASNQLVEKRWANFGNNNYIPIGLWWNCSNDKRSIREEKINFMDAPWWP